MIFANYTWPQSRFKLYNDFLDNPLCPKGYIGLLYNGFLHVSPSVLYNDFCLSPGFANILRTDVKTLIKYFLAFHAFVVLMGSTQRLACDVRVRFPWSLSIQCHLHVLMATFTGCCLLLFFKFTLLMVTDQGCFSDTFSQRPLIKWMLMFQWKWQIDKKRLIKTQGLMQVNYNGSWRSSVSTRGEMFNFDTDTNVH